MADPANLGGESRTPLHVPGPPQEPTEQEMVVRGLDANKLQRLQAMVDGDMNVGDISTALSIPSSVIVMFKEDRPRFNSLRGAEDPRNLGGGAPLTGGGNDAGGRSYRPGIMKGPIGPF